MNFGLPLFKKNSIDRLMMLARKGAFDESAAVLAIKQLETDMEPWLSVIPNGDYESFVTDLLLNDTVLGSWHTMGCLPYSDTNLDVLFQSMS